MQAIREIRTVEKGEVILSLPHTFWGQQVEIIILPLQPQPETQRQKKSLRGCLHQYANPELIDLEATAWSAAAEDTHVSGGC